MLTDAQIEAAMGPCDDSDLARGMRAQFVASFKRVYAKLPQPVASGEPTEEMELAGMRALRNTYRTATGVESREQARACWLAMLAAQRGMSD